MRHCLNRMHWLRVAACLVVLLSLVPGMGYGTQWPENLDEAKIQLDSLKDSAPVYEAQSATTFHIRNLPRDNAYWLLEVKKARQVSVLLYGEEWCVIQYRTTIGYARTRWLTYFRSLDPFNAPVPDLERQSGIATVTAPVSAAVESYTGNAFHVGDVVTVLTYGGEDARINMMRSTAALPADALAFTAFTAWESAQPGECIAAYTTYYNETTGGRLSDNRRYNIELAAERINGATLAPGGTFSFNGCCGPYRKANGYLLAPNISKDGTGYGGGVCQVTTTLYNAVLHLPLQVEAWCVHRDIGVDYIKVGFDAAVGSRDFSFTNTLSYPITISALPQNGVLTVLISRSTAQTDN